MELSPRAQDRLLIALDLYFACAFRICPWIGSYPRSCDPEDSLGLSKVWGFTVETLFGAALFYVWSWHDARQIKFDMPMKDADRDAIWMANYVAHNWPNKWERRALKCFVKFGFLVRLYSLVRWEWIGGKN